MNPLLLISADCHAEGQPQDFEPYIGSAHRDDYADYVAALRKAGAIHPELAKPDEGGGKLFSQEALEEYQSQDMVAAGGTSGLWDADRRVKELEADGTVAEVIFPNGAPFGAFEGASWPAELQRVGREAYNQWLADFCSQHPDRRAGIAIINLADVDTAVKEVELAATLGLRGVVTSMVYDAPYVETLEPVWAACAANNLPVHIHAGGARSDAYGAEGVVRIMFHVSEGPWRHTKPFWFLLWTGVFERHPGLRLVLSETRLGPLPDMLYFLDDMYSKSLFQSVRDLIPRKPSEYWHRQVYANASFLDARECSLRNEVGVDRIMWGSDYPHVEGTWPHSLRSLAEALPGVPEADARAILGLNAARVYGFDAARLSELATTVGPTAGDLQLSGG